MHGVMQNLNITTGTKTRRFDVDFAKDLHLAEDDDNDSETQCAGVLNNRQMFLHGTGRHNCATTHASHQRLCF